MKHRRSFQIATLSLGSFWLSISAIRAVPDEGESLRRAVHLASERRCDEAARLLEGIDPTSRITAPALYCLAECFMKRNDWKKAEPVLESFLKISPQDPSALFLKAYLLFRTARYQESLIRIARFVELQPDNPDARKILGMDYYMLGRTEEAELELKRATELLPDDPEATYYLGRLYFTRNKMLAALTAFQRAIQLDPSSVKAHNHLGQTYEGLAQYEAARQAYLKAIELEKQQPAKSQWPYFNLGTLCLKEGRFPEAIDYLRQALLRNASWTEGKLKLAKALLGARDLSGAQVLLREVIEAQPQNAAAHYQLARLLSNMGEREQAAHHYEQFRKLKKP